MDAMQEAFKSEAVRVAARRRRARRALVGEMEQPTDEALHPDHDLVFDPDDVDIFDYVEYTQPIFNNVGGVIHG